MNSATLVTAVFDIQSSIEKGKKNGAKIVIEPNKTPVGLYASIRDPEGNAIGLLEPAR